jgi:hypothetical protein
MLTVMRLVKESRRYPADLGFEDEIKAVSRRDSTKIPAKTDIENVNR